MQKVKMVLKRFGKVGIISAFLVVVFVVGNSTGYPPKVHVLGVSTHAIPTPTSLPSPTPTSVPVVVINNIIVPTQMPIIITQVATPTPVQSASPTPTPFVQPTIIPTPTVFPSPTPTPTPVVQSITINIDYSGQHATGTYTTAIASGETAWEAVQHAVGLANVHYTDYGGSLGVFITGFNGIDASQNQYYDFQINGVSASVGVSSYVIQSGDILRFVLSGF